MQKFLQICCSDIDLYLSNKNIFWKYERTFCILICYEKKPLVVPWDSFSFARHLYFRNMSQTGKFWDPKIRVQRWIWLSQYAMPVGKLRDFIVLWYVVNKNLWAVCKLILQWLIIPVLKWYLFIVKHPFRWLSKTKAHLPCLFLQRILGLYFVHKPSMFTKNWYCVSKLNIMPMSAFGG